MRQTIKALVAAATISATATAIQQVARADFPPHAVNDKELQQSSFEGPVALRGLTQFKSKALDASTQPQQSKSDSLVALRDFAQFKPQGLDAATEPLQFRSDGPVAFTDLQLSIAYSYSPQKLDSRQVSSLGLPRGSFLDSLQFSFLDSRQVSFFDSASAVSRPNKTLQPVSLPRPEQREASAPAHAPSLAPERFASLESLQDTDLSPARQLRSPIAHVVFEAPTLAPMAHTIFCLKYRADCAIDKSVSPDSLVTLTSNKWADLKRVNAAVNRAIVPHPNTKGLAGEVWLISPKAGECHDYAVTKRHNLLALGWPEQDLLLAEVVTSWGEHHLVLVIRTRDGDFVADNLSPEIRLWSQTPYQWVRIQSPSNPMIWSTMVNSTTRAQARRKALRHANAS